MPIVGWRSAPQAEGHEHLQMAPLALPGMVIGNNRFTYTDQSPDTRMVRLTHEWVERSASRPPEAPSEPIFPHAGGRERRDRLRLQWKPAPDPDGDRIADYHFELSARADLKWPLSMSFAKLTSRTSDAGQPRYTVPGAGLLNPDREYFWHVRARTTRVCGDHGPRRGTSLRADRRLHDTFTLEFDSARTRGILRWAPSPTGRAAVAYRFTPATSRASPPTTSLRGDDGCAPSNCLPSSPANFVTEDSGNRA